MVAGVLEERTKPPIKVDNPETVSTDSVVVARLVDPVKVLSPVIVWLVVLITPLATLEASGMLMV